MKIFHAGAIALVLAVACALTGCGGSQPTGTVTGTVTFQGKPITYGTISFETDGAKQNPVANGFIREGKYTLTNVATGSAKICVQSLPTAAPKKTVGIGEKTAPAAPTESGSMPQGPFVEIPSKYHRTVSSGLTYEVKTGDQTYDITLTP